MVMSSTLVKPRATVGALLLLSMMLIVFLSASLNQARAASVSVPVLPDDRGYEKVSPNNNADGNVYAAWPLELANEGGYTYLPYKSSPNGDALAYIGMPSEEDGSGREGGTRGEQYVARRATDGRWEATNVMPPSDEVSTIPAYQGFSTDLSHGFLTTNAGVPLVPGTPAEHYHVPYVRDFETGAYESLLAARPPDRLASQFRTSFAGSSADFSHVLYAANDALTANAVDVGAEDKNLYDFHDGQLTLVNVLPDGLQEPSAVFGGPRIIQNTEGEDTPDFSHVISEDGNRIYWTGQGANKNIYMREDGTTTVQVDAAVGGGGQYWTATPNGSEALFAKTGDLYKYEVAGGKTTDLTPGAEVQGVVGASEDLSYIYFVANAALTAGAGQGDCSGIKSSGECGLYVLHAGEPIKFIAMLSSKDDETWPNSFHAVTGDWQGGLANKEAEVTPNGSQVLFSSVQPLTGYDNLNREGRRAEELYVYEFATAKLHCISCIPSGEPPSLEYYAAFLPVSNQAAYSMQWMSDDGSRVFFDSVDALIPQDTNGLNDVYEWERDGSGGCESGEGCIYLLTGGTGGEGAFMIDSSSSGDDVFFTSRAQLGG